MKFGKIILLKISLVLLFVFIGKAESKPENDECLNCHSVLGDELQKPADLYVNDVHYSLGISCALCHGGDPKTDDSELSMSKQYGFRGVPVKKERYLACIKCHSDKKVMNSYGSNKTVDQYEKLKKSVHFNPSYDNQGPIADCITCHGIHNIARIKSVNSLVFPTKIVALCGSCHSNAAFMKNYSQSLPVDQVEKYKTSIHGLKNAMGDINVAECASCHGSHEIRKVNDPYSLVYPVNIPKVCSGCHSDKAKMAPYKIASNQYYLYVNSVHGKALLEKGDLNAPSCNDCHGNHGAVPPQVESISKVCGSCHVLNMEMFEKSVHKQAFDKAHIPECEGCHGNHNVITVSDEFLGGDKQSFCIKCHKTGDNGFKTAVRMKKLIDSLKLEEMQAKIILEEASQRGMDVSNELFALKDIRQILIQTRIVLHSFDQNMFDETIKTGYEITASAKSEGNKEIDNYYFRRKGLAISTFIVTLLVIGLYFKIKRIEKNN